MRELVQFYYLWKKSERRDQNFANADTVDHMDIYLNEDNDYGSNNITPAASPNTATFVTGTTTRRNSNSFQKNISIMTGGASGVSANHLASINGVNDKVNNATTLPSASSSSSASTAANVNLQHRKKMSSNQSSTDMALANNSMSK